MSVWTSARFDLQPVAALRVQYVIAGTYRCGSTLLASALAETGALGVPWEYFNYENEMELMKLRLGVEAGDTYLSRLQACRTSPNGVFGVKCHYHHFAAARDESAAVRAFSSLARYIYVDRRDKLAQAVSMAKALQTNAWASFGKARRSPLFYSRNLIDDCLEELQDQAEGWWRWFEAHAHEPFVVDYDDLVADPKATVWRVAGFLGVDLDLNASHPAPAPERQSDAVNAEWIARFRSEEHLGASL